MRREPQPEAGRPGGQRDRPCSTIVDAEEPPLRMFFGDGPLAIATADYESRLATWRQWEPVSIAAGGQGGLTS